MFKARVFFYRNVDGKEEKVEKEFNSSKSYNKFISAHPEYSFLENFKLIDEKNVLLNKGKARKNKKIQTSI